jgi:hypothetical protein
VTPKGCAQPQSDKAQRPATLVDGGPLRWANEADAAPQDSSPPRPFVPRSFLGTVSHQVIQDQFQDQE